MNIEWSWSFPPPIVIPSYKGYENVIKVLNYYYIGKDTVSGYSFTIMGAIQMDLDSLDPSQFIQFDQLTEETIMSWVNTLGNVNIEKMQSDITKQIEIQINPPVINKPFPWGNPN